MVEKSSRTVADLKDTLTRYRLITFVIALLTVFFAWPWLFTLAGDAQVHLAVAEQFSQGHPFLYNPSDEPVVASTSPFWTLLLTLFFWVAQYWTPLLLKGVVVLIWLCTSYLVYRIARDVWHLQDYALLAVIGLWLTQTMITSNALGGLENILSALQLLWTYYLSAKWRDQLTYRHSLALGFLLGWAILTRPDGGLFCAGVIALYAVIEKVSPGNRKRTSAQWTKQFGLIVIVALLVIFPWYAFQYHLTGKLVTDSSIARLYTGRRGSIALIDNLLYVHPKALVSLITGFLPLVVGLGLATADLVRNWIRRRGQTIAFFLDNYPPIASLFICVSALLFYTFIVGADSFARYFLPIFPFYFLSGVVGLCIAERLLQRRRTFRVPVLLTLALLFMLAVSSMDFYRRVVVERFDNGPTLNVIYGPADLRYFAFNVPDIIAAPLSRSQRTAQMRQALGIVGSEPIRFAVTEVQLRYFVDESVTVQSLDGRTSAEVLNYFDPASGIPDFARYFDATHPDFVHVAQWCYVGDWRASLSRSLFQSNLICDWQDRIGKMQIGDAFDWEGNRVVYVAPQIVQIIWKGADTTLRSNLSK